MTLAHPLVASVGAPFLIALVVAVALRRTGPHIAWPLAVTAGGLASVLLLLGPPDWPPRTAVSRLPWLIALGGLLALLTRELLLPRWRGVAAALMLLAGALWMVLRRLDDPLILSGVLGLLLTLGLVLWRPRLRDGLPALLCFGGAVCAIAFLAGSLVLAQSSAAVLASVVGATVIGAARGGLDPADTLFTALGTWLLIAFATPALAAVPTWTLSPLLALMPALLLAGALPGGGHAAGRALWQALLSGAVVALCIALRELAQGGSGLYYQ